MNNISSNLEKLSKIGSECNFDSSFDSSIDNRDHCHNHDNNHNNNHSDISINDFILDQKSNSNNNSKQTQNMNNNLINDDSVKLKDRNMDNNLITDDLVELKNTSNKSAEKLDEKSERLERLEKLDEKLNEKPERLDEKLDEKLDEDQNQDWVMISSDTKTDNTVTSIFEPFLNLLSTNFPMTQFHQNADNILSLNDDNQDRDESNDFNMKYNMYIKMCIVKLANIVKNNKTMSEEDINKHFQAFIKYDEALGVLVDGKTTPLYKKCCIDGFRSASISNDLKIAKYLYKMNNVKTGEKRGMFELSYKSIFEISSKSLTPRLRDEIPSDIFIASCESNSLEVIVWMLSVETFDIDVIIKGFISSIKKNNAGMIDVIANELTDRPEVTLAGRGIINNDFIEKCINDFLEDDCLQGLKWIYVKYRNVFQKSINNLFIKSCNDCRLEICRWLMNLLCNDSFNMTKASKRKMIIASIKNAVLEGSHENELVISEIVNILLKTSENKTMYSSNNTLNEHFPDIFDIFFDMNNMTDINAIFVDALHKDLVNTTILIGNIKIYSVIVTCSFDSEKSSFALLDDHVTNPTTLCDTIVNLLVEIGRPARVTSDRNYKHEFDIMTQDKLLSTKKTITLEENELISVITTLLDRHKNQKTQQSGLTFVKKEFVLNKVQKYLSGKEQKIEKADDSISKIEIKIQSKWCISQDLIKTELKSSNIIASVKDVLAKLLGEQMSLGHSFDYKKALSLELKLMPINKKSKFIRENIRDAEECMMECSGECDMMLDCHDVMCMCCAFEWYIKQNKPRICQVCRREISLEKSYYLEKTN
jgi:hypothetical protein